MALTSSLIWPALVTLAAGLVYFWTAHKVGTMRGKLGIPAPAMTGHPDFERAVRVQANTLEQIVLFYPLLWLAALTIWPNLAAFFGAIWVVGRIVYARAYFASADQRGAGFLIGFAAMVLLFLQTLIGIARILLT